MKALAIFAAFALTTTAVYAQTAPATAPSPPVVSAPTATPTCKAQAIEKKLAGAAMTSFMTKCEKDASAACTKSAADKKLAGAAMKSFTTKCTSSAVGT